MSAPAIRVFIGTKAQYIKTAPLLRLLDAAAAPYRLIDSGQHGRFSVGLRQELGVRDPDVVLGTGRDVASIGAALRWSSTSLRLAARGDALRRVFGDGPGICVVHGDTPSTFVATVLARRAGLEVAHLEAGLRSWHALHPFPEELIRVVVMRRSGLLFAPDDTAVANLRRMGVRGRIVPTGGNSTVEALAWSLGETAVEPAGPAVATLHRVENLHRASRIRGFVELLTEVASDRPIVMIVHPPTAAILERTGDLIRLANVGVEIRPLVDHRTFVRMVAAAPFVVTDGGSVQEEAALLGVPTLLWRLRSERPDGLGANVVLSRYDTGVARRFVARPDGFRRAPVDLTRRPSAVVLETLLAEPAVAARSRS